MASDERTARPDTAQILAPPPLIFLAAVLIGLGLQVVRPLSIFAHAIAVRVAGGVLMLVGLALSGSVMRHFGRAGTPVIPWQATTHLVRPGPYRFSRNPDYVGQALLAAGLGLALAAPWVLVALLPALVIVRYGVIAREERYLERKFGDEYRQFCRQVRRWL